MTLLTYSLEKYHNVIVISFLYFTDRDTDIETDVRELKVCLDDRIFSFEFPFVLPMSRIFAFNKIIL